MLSALYRLDGRGLDPHENLAVEEALLSALPPRSAALYLWQNRRTVVVGRNQNALAECRAALLLAEDGRLARRISGGGAVFHDLGNLNFTFVAPAAEYSVDRQLGVVLRALSAFGIHAEKTGRNDLTADGRKFSGNAFYHRGGVRFHHGTRLCLPQGELIARYLNVSPDKLAAKGVPSVRARVTCLAEHAPDITVDALREALYLAFAEEYALPLSPFPAERIDEQAVAALKLRNGSDAWLYGRRLPATARRALTRFGWGGVELLLVLEAGRIADAAVYSDALEQDFFAALPALLRGCAPDDAALFPAISALGEREGCAALAAELAAWLLPALAETLL